MTKVTQLGSGVHSHSLTTALGAEWVCPPEIPVWCRDRPTKEPAAYVGARMGISVQLAFAAYSLSWSSEASPAKAPSAE